MVLNMHAYQVQNLGTLKKKKFTASLTQVVRIPATPGTDSRTSRMLLSTSAS